MKKEDQFDYDYIIVGSGFGGSVSALRLSEKGYKVLVLEKGKEFGPDDFPKSNWNLFRWLWAPVLKCFGIFKMTVFRHVTIFSGVGVGGGSLVYANTLPMPKKKFFDAPSWSNLADWEQELQPHYKTAQTMLGSDRNPKLWTGDEALRQVGIDLGKEDHFEPTDVAVFFGEPEKVVPDPYFDGEGPERAGCHFCGACMIGCRHNAKNTLDKNYLYLARKKGVEVKAEAEVYDVAPVGAKDGSEGYVVRWKKSTSFFGGRGEARAAGIVFSGGVLGTVKLLLKLKNQRSMPDVSEQLGRGVRTNSEALLAATTTDSSLDLSEGVAITSILHVDDDSHIEPVRYPKGSGFFRLAIAPTAVGSNIFARVIKSIIKVASNPIGYFKAAFTPDWARSTQILLFMQTLDSTLRLREGIFGMKSSIDCGEAPTPFIPLAHDLANRFAEKVKAIPMALFTETLFGMASTAHILGGCCMGEDDKTGVVDKDNHLFGYKNALVCDGSMISANPGVNPSLTITALSERAMSKIPEKGKQ